jgi:hydrogenase maturation protease
MTDAGATFVILGVGNVLLRDDGVGIHVVRELQRRVRRAELVLPPGTQVMDGGTLGPDLAKFIAGARAIVLVDALADGGSPGSIVVLDGAAVAVMARQVTSAAARVAGWGETGVTVTTPLELDGVTGLLGRAGQLGVAPEAISLVGIRPADIDVGLELSDSVAAALPAAAAAVLDELARLARNVAPAAPGPGQAARRAAEAAA